MEAAYLSALQQRDIEDEKLLREGFAFDLGEAAVELQKRRETEAKDNKRLVDLHKVRSEKLRDRYNDWLKAGRSENENKQIKELWAANTYRNASITIDAATTVAQFYQPTGLDIVTKIFAAPAYALAVASSAVAKGLAGGAETAAQVAGINASYERRAQEWTLQRDLANADIEINKQQFQIATDQENIVRQERVIAEMQRDQAVRMKNFLLKKFLSSEFYDWMASELSEVYAYFLQQATSTAQLAQNQLAFDGRNRCSRTSRRIIGKCPRNLQIRQDDQAVREKPKV